MSAVLASAPARAESGDITRLGNPAKSAPARVLIVTPRFLPEMGGIETHVNEIAPRLAARGHQTSILTTDNSGELPREERISGVRVRRVRAWPSGKDWRLAPGIFREIMASDCDVVHVQGCHTLVAPLAMMACLIKGAPFVVTFHSGGHSSELRTRMRGAQWAVLAPLFRRAAGWIGVSRFEAEFFSESMRLPRARVEVVPNGAAMPKSVAEEAGERVLIVSVGRLERYKGHHRVISAFAELLKRRPEAELRIVGEGPYRQNLEALVEKLGLSEKVEIGGVPPSDRDGMARILSSAKLVMLMSEYEAHPVAVMEALAMGRPVLATDCSGFKELAEASMIDVVAPDASDAEVASAAERLLSAPRERPAVALPTWEACADRVSASLESAFHRGS